MNSRDDSRGYPKSRGGNRQKQPFNNQKSHQQSSNQGRRNQAAFPENQSSEQPVHGDESSRKLDRNYPPGTRSYSNNTRPGFHGGNSHGSRTFTFSRDEPRSAGSDNYNRRQRSSERNSGRSSTSSVSQTGDKESENNVQTPAGTHVETKSGAFDCEEISPDVKKEDQTDYDTTKNTSGGNGTESQKRRSKDSSFFREIEDNLFTAPNDVSLVHCVGADFRMGSGIAIKFQERFDSVGELFDQKVGPGGVAHLCRGQRYVFYLVTKQASKGKPTNDAMRQSLISLRDKCQNFGVSKLAMPRIGCGLDGLLWEDVKKMLLEIFAEGFTITIYNMEDPACGRRNVLKSRVKNDKSDLKDIATGTGLLYLGCADASVTAEMESLNEKYPFISHLRSLKKLPLRLGTTFFSIAKDEKVFGLICKESADSPLNYKHLESALAHLNELNKRDKYEYFGIQAFVDKGDAYVMDKINTLLRNFPGDAEFWICWPPALECMCPPEPEQAQDNMEVKKSQQVPVAVQQSKFTQQSNSRKSTESKNVDKKDRKSTAEVAEKITTESRIEPVESWEDNLNPDVPIVEVHDVPNTNESDWPMENDSEQIDNFEDGSWDDVGSMTKTDNATNYEDHADAERRKSKEKKEATKMMRQKEKQERRSGGPKSCVTEFQGDLFDADDSISLAHCVGADLRMGSGIAVLFRQKFGSLPDLLGQNVTQGGVAFIQHEKRFVFYLVTKRESTGKPTYDTLRASLHALHKKCKSLNVTEIAMPRIGCGLDRLSWDQVKPMIEEIFSDGFTIKVYNLEKPEYYGPHSSNWGKKSWRQSDNYQPSDLLQAMQRTLDSLTSKVYEIDNKLENKTIDSGTRTEVNQILLEMSELRQTIQDLDTKIDSWEPQRNSERLEIVERKLIDQDAEIQRQKEMIENLQQQLQRQETTVPVPSFSSYHDPGQSRRFQKSNGGHPRFNYLDGPPPLVANSTPAQVYTGPTGMYLPGAFSIYPPMDNGMSESYGYTSPASCLNSNHCIFATESLLPEKEALLRRAKEVARSYGHSIREVNGNIFAMKSDNSQGLPITGYDDLKTLENW